ncbi:MAG TPA: tRNA pseudouridine(55) synthase [Myxococcaceae bacterium]|jgi:tRNA pseudouridine55 synthase
MEPGIHLVHKPAGPTSADVLRDALAQEPGGRARACHGGTLDPFASGLLLVLTGGATRLFDFLHVAPKRYFAEVRWGVETHSGDALGEPVTRGDPSTLSPEALDGALANFLGWTEQVPPSTSAKKIGGEPAYKKVHRGEAVSLPPSRVYLHSARWESHHLPEASFLSITCRGGYYVRALARDLGRALGARAHLGELRRSWIGPWQDPGAGVHPWPLARGANALPWAFGRILTDWEVGELRRDRPIARGELEPPRWRVPDDFPLDPPPPILGLHLGKLIYLLTRSAESLVPKTILPGGI